MGMKIIILEDNDERQLAMRDCLSDRFFQYEPQFFATAGEMIDYLQENIQDAIVISLDHDLEMISGSEGDLHDPGTGREVADYLAGCEAVCPVIIHTTNSPAAIGMEMALQESGWETMRVVPHDDLVWIAEDWFPAMRRAIVGPVDAPIART